MIAILNAIAALPALARYLEKFCQVLIGWYVSRQQSAVLSAIADAAAFSARAKTEDERYAAATQWQKALSLPRTTA